MQHNLSSARCLILMPRSPDILSPDPAVFLRLAGYRMPLGRYRGHLLIDLPEPYVVWYANKGFPDGELGQLLALVYEIKVNGLEYLFEPLREQSQE